MRASRTLLAWAALLAAAPARARAERWDLRLDARAALAGVAGEEGSETAPGAGVEAAVDLGSADLGVDVFASGVGGDGGWAIASGARSAALALTYRFDELRVAPLLRLGAGAIDRREEERRVRGPQTVLGVGIEARIWAGLTAGWIADRHAAGGPFARTVLVRSGLRIGWRW